MEEQTPQIPNQPDSFWKRQKDRWKKFRGQRPRTSNVIKWSGILGLAGISFILGLFLLVWLNAFGRIPSTNDLKNIENDAAAEVYSSDGKVLGKYYVENRINIPYESISPYLINALVATEDARFFDHSGVDLRAWGRVLTKTILMSDESSGGGSTLSQQLAKNLFPRKRYKILGVLISKIKETYVARRLEKVYSKDELISLYLNTVPFGGNIFGVEVAAQQFFNTTAKDIKPEESAVLVGMLKANTYYHPVRNPERSEKRRNVVLQQMQKYGHLTPVICDSLQALPLKVDYRREGNNDGQATYFREYLRQELAEKVKTYSKKDGTPYNLYTDGLKIYTTIDSRLQGYAEDALHGHLGKLQKDFAKHWKGRKVWGKDEVLEREIEKSERFKKLKAAGKSDEYIRASFRTPVKMTIFSYEGDEVKEMSPLDSIQYYYQILNAGFLAMNPKNGHLLAWVGGIDHQYFQYDHTQSKRQVGSTFKPIVYTRALQNGIYPCDYLDNHLVTYTDYEDWQPQNSDGKYGGVYSMAGGLSKSVNSVAVNLIMQTGIDSVRQLAQAMGIKSDIPRVPAIALGAVDASLYEMIQVYGTFANRGIHQNPLYLTRIETADGQELFNIAAEETETGERVLSMDHADIMIKMMEAVVDSGTAKRLRYVYGIKGPIAGKTGTTQSQADGWFMGFTPDIVAGAWVGGESPRVRFRSLSLGQGSNTALPIWGRFMQSVYKDREFSKWQRSVFPVPSVEVLEMLDCADYLEEVPSEEEEIIEGIAEEIAEGLNTQIDNLLNALKGKKKDKKVNRNPAEEAREEAEKRSEEIRKKNEKTKRKRERKKKRKEFFDNMFGNE